MIVSVSLKQETRKQRNSNLELYRIILMLLIIAHHYVVNSGLFKAISWNPTSIDSICFYIIGMWGKIGINCFMLITGYFMCKSSITLKKYVKLILQVEFYYIVIYLIFVLSGYITFSVKDLLISLIPIREITDGFTSTFLVFFLFIPFLNILVQNMNKRQHGYLIFLCLFIYSFWAQYSIFVVGTNYVIWFSIIYIIASYLRFYPFKFKDSFWGWMSILSILLSLLSIVFSIWYGLFPYFFVTDSNAPLAVVISVSSFMYFKDIKLKYTKWINIMGGSIFGILLIHTNSDVMRQWLWVDTLNNVGWYYSDYKYLHAIISVLGVFIICFIIEQFRQRCVEKYTNRIIDKYIHR